MLIVKNMTTVLCFKIMFYLQCGLNLHKVELRAGLDI